MHAPTYSSNENVEIKSDLYEFKHETLQQLAVQQEQIQKLANLIFTLVQPTVIFSQMRDDIHKVNEQFKVLEDHQKKIFEILESLKSKETTK